MMDRNDQHKNAELRFLERMAERTLQDGKFLAFQETLKAVDSSYHTDLSDLFAPVAYYDALILAEARAGSLEIECPDNGTNVEGELCFKVKNAAEGDLKLTIENNKEDVLIKTVFKASGAATEEYILKLPAEDFGSGRYYWKMRSSEGMVIREFFVNKDLMPKNIRRSA